MKYMLMIAVVGVVIMKFKIDVAGFLTGCSLLFPCIVLEAVIKLAAREDR